MKEIADKAPPDIDAERMLADLADSLDESVLFLSPVGVVLAANRTAGFWMGMRSRSALVGHSIFEFLPDELAGARRALLADAVRRRRKVRFEDETDNRTFAHRLTPHAGPDGAVRYVSVVSTDITHVRRSDQKLRREQQRQIFFMESLPGFFYLAAEDRTIRYSNRTFKRYFGRPEGKLCNELIDACPTACGLCPPPGLFSEGKPCEWEWTNQEDGRTFRMHCHPMTDIDGSPLAAILGIDITLRKKAEAELLATQRGLEETVQRRTGELEAANRSLTQEIEEHKRTELALKEAMHRASAAVRAKSSFLANMSHEIRTPMNAVMGMTELALSATDGERRRHYLEMVREAGNALLTIINDILDYSKVEARKLTLERIHFDLPATLASALRIHEQQARAKRLWLKTTLGDGVPRHVVGDPMRLRQILVNLMGNAVKFTEEGGIDVGVTVDGEADANGVPLRFSVCDTGIGVPRDKQQDIFESFSQVDDSVTRQYGGTGLGLTISSHLVQLMGGRIDLESAPGEGSSFSFTIHMPVGDPAQVPPPPAPVAEQSPGRALSVLLVEDNELNRELATTVLADLGHEVVEAANGDEALWRLGRRDFDVVLMDVQMPVMDGISATRAVRSGAHGVRNPDVPIVAMTAHAMKGDRERFLRAGMNGYLAKPLDLATMAAEIGRVVREAEEAEVVERTPRPAGPGADPGAGKDASGSGKPAGPPPPTSATAPENPADAVLDVQGALGRLNGNRPLLDKLFDLFLKATPLEMDKLSMAADDGNWDQ
jgi:signal transduction histidine kinase/AmiR/NasT family two-component response regulator